MELLSLPDALDRARADAAVHALWPGLSRRTARKLVECGAVGRARDGEAPVALASPREALRAGDTLALDPSAVERSIALGLRVVNEDDALLVLEKPAGLAVHGGPLVDDSVAARLAEACPGAGLAHRLDRGTSGLLLVGRSAAALRGLASDLDSIERTYTGLVLGVVDRDTTIDVPLRVLDEPMGAKPKVVPDAAEGQPARTHVRVVARYADASLVELRLETGRTHQIRAHLLHLGHPLLGDPRYGDAARNEWARATLGVARPMLHAARLAFAHPSSGEQVECEAFAPADLARAVAHFRRAPRARADR